MSESAVGRVWGSERGVLDGVWVVMLSSHETVMSVRLSVNKLCIGEDVVELIVVFTFSFTVLS